MMRTQFGQYRQAALSHCPRIASCLRVDEQHQYICLSLVCQMRRTITIVMCRLQNRVSMAPFPMRNVSPKIQSYDFCTDVVHSYQIVHGIMYI